MNKITHLLSLILILLVFSASAKTKKLKTVFTKQVKIEKLFNLYTYPAKLVSEKKSFVLAENQGRVVKLHKGLGEKVKKNDLILTIKHDDPAYNYRTQKILSPINGVVASHLVEEGTKVSKGEKLCLVIDPKKIKIVAEITLKDMNVIKKGSVAILTYPGTKSKSEAVVTGISPMIDLATGTATAWLKLKDAKGFMPGTIGTLKFKSNLHKGIEVTKDAIVYLGRKTFVRTVDEKNIVTRLEVDIISKTSGVVEITKGLKEGQNVIVRSSGFLADGSTVKVQNKNKKEKKK